MALAMGFSSVDDVLTHGDVLREWIVSATPMRRFDWLRALLLTEIVFASNAIGSGLDWPITSGISDHESIALLRCNRPLMDALRSARQPSCPAEARRGDSPGGLRRA
jgi:hypothetical protein